ncbi:RNA-guided endonuclease InsQ/TnpB family protein [Laspinema olomoucense]|uniref:RNA-guided endonuclease InsQ/TnpB family protein n=1 Tax=Laspinema olomoucense TaxID=3231600 RepID=UPI0021BA924B|nr:MULTISPECIES: transposase [unclassified Laspinema]MCT7974799.1 transposase [Laspinema sp. D3d]MCT7988210.1 transposase [Laspinema sp. D3a]MCT7994693.1 transposase [Laspinema sp. D3c]
MIYKAWSTKLKLNDRQATLMAKHAGYARKVFNWGLRLWMSAYEEGLKPNINSIKKVFTNYVKPQYPWMSELSSRVYQYAFINLGDAFKRFFQGISSYPKFKKKGHHDSFTLDNCGKPIRLSGTRHKLPFVGWVSTFEALPPSVVKKVTITRQAGDWYMSFFVEIPQEITPKCREKIGVDLGINTLATCSDGTTFSNASAYKSATKKLGRLQRHLSRKVKGSKNRAKCLLKVQRLHQRVANIRRDTLHKITTFLAKNHSQVVIEDLNVSGMLKNHCLAGSIADASFYEFRRQLDYKSSRYGSKLIIADRFYPSSQLCSNCGHRQKMPLNQRTFECQNCSLKIDRDLNASVNLEKSSGFDDYTCGRGAADSPGRSKK